MNWLFLHFSYNGAEHMHNAELAERTLSNQTFRQLRSAEMYFPRFSQHGTVENIFLRNRNPNLYITCENTFSALIKTQAFITSQVTNFNN